MSVQAGALCRHAEGRLNLSRGEHIICPLFMRDENLVMTSRNGVIRYSSEIYYIVITTILILRIFFSISSYGMLSFSLSRSTCPLTRTDPGSPSSTVTEACLVNPSPHPQSHLPNHYHPLALHPSTFLKC